MWTSVQVSPQGESAEKTEGIQHNPQTTCSVVLMLLAYGTLEGTLMTCPVKTNNSLGAVWSDNQRAFYCSYIVWLACIRLGKLTKKQQSSLTLTVENTQIATKKILNMFLIVLYIIWTYKKVKFCVFFSCVNWIINLHCVLFWWITILKIYSMNNCELCSMSHPAICIMACLTFSNIIKINQRLYISRAQ